MEFRVKKHSKGEGSEKDEKRDKKAAHDESSDTSPGEEEKDEEHGEEQDAEQESKKQAGQDMIDAIKAGEPMDVFKAHRHLHHIHMTSSPEEGGDDPAGVEPHKTSSLVDAIKGMPVKTGV